MQAQNQPLAYFIEKDHTLVHISPEAFIQIACDPLQNISIQACAGSGKTWLLASRILRLLLADVSPQQILALTFTKKAAFEMQERVLAWLAHWQTLDDAALQNELEMRGLSKNQGEIDSSLLNKARGLYTTLINQPLYLNISTFDVWFKDLLAQLPLFLLNPIPENLLTETAQYFEDLLLKISISLKNNIDINNVNYINNIKNIEYAFEQLKNNYRLDDSKIKTLFSKLFQKRDSQSQYLKNNFKINLNNNLNNEEFCDLLLDQAKISNLKTEMMSEIRPHINTQKYQNVYQKLEQAEDAFSIYQAITVQKKDDILKLDKALGFHARAQEFKNYFLQHKSKALQYTLGLLLKAYAQAKQNDGFYDFSDILAQLIHLGDDFLNLLPATHQHQHILLDEFQDTNPTQWAFIQNYLKYLTKKNINFKLFVVGDDKQAIYRFRGGDVRVMKAPQTLEIENFGGISFNWQILSTQNTRRCAQAVVQYMNQALRNENTHGLYPIFIEHSSQHPDIGEAYILELAENSAAEMLQLSQHLLQIKQKHALQWRDILIISRARSKWLLLESALNQAGIPFFAHRKGGLLHAAAICDLLALLRICLPAPDRYHMHIVENSPLQDFIKNQEAMQILQNHSQIQTAPAFLSMVLQHSNFYQHYPQANDQFYIQQLYELSLEYAENHGTFYGVADFLEDVQKHIYSRFSSETPSALLPSFNAVEINTIHGVKGLEAKWVVVIDANAPFTFQADILNDWPVEAAYPKASFIGNKDLYTSLCPHLLEEEQSQQMQGYYNLLYVAITRAKYGVIVTGSKYRGKIAENSWFDLLDRTWPCLKNNINNEDEDEGDDDEDAEDINIAIFAENKEKTKEQVKEQTKEQPPMRLHYDFSIPLYQKHNACQNNQQRSAGLKILKNSNNESQAQIFGKMAHFILETLGEKPRQKIHLKHLKNHPTIAGYLKSIRPYFNDDAELALFYQSAWQSVEILIHMPHLEKIFNPAATAIILCEYELQAVLSMHTKQIFRIDRLIITPEETLIIDYKFGEHQSSSMETYKQQLLQYKAAVAQINLYQENQINQQSQQPKQPQDLNSLKAYLLFKNGELIEVD